MDRDFVEQTLIDTGIVAILRLPDGLDFYPVIRGLIDGGVKVIELTLTMKNAIPQIGDLVRKFGQEAVIGAGTVRTSKDALAASAAGAAFVVSPIVDLGVSEVCRTKRLAYFPGAFSPREVVEASLLGSTMVKVFPSSVLGPKYLTELLGPFPELSLLPTGGVSLETAPVYLKAGARALGVGSDLVSSGAALAGDSDRIAITAAKFRAIYDNHRPEKELGVK